MRKTIFIITILAIFLIACQQTKQPVTLPPIDITTPMAKQLPDNPEYEPPPTEPYKIQNEIKIEAINNQFLPSEIKVQKNEIVRLIVTSMDKDYTFTILEYGIKEELKRGEDVEIDILPNKSGTFTYYDSDNLNMKGKLVIT